MKAIKNKILSVLLFSFFILTTHDYLMADSTSNNGFTLVKSEKIVLDFSKLHTKIHSAMDIPRTEIVAMQVKGKSGKILNTQASVTSYINPVLLRPPSL